MAQMSPTSSTPIPPLPNMRARTSRAAGIIGRPALSSPVVTTMASTGTIVVAPGDILLPQNIYVRDPIIYTIEDTGWITDIRGGLDADWSNPTWKVSTTHVAWA